MQVFCSELYPISIARMEPGLGPGVIDLVFAGLRLLKPLAGFGADRQESVPGPEGRKPCFGSECAWFTATAGFSTPGLSLARPAVKQGGRAMNRTTFLHQLANGCRIPAACLLAAAAICMLWTGLGLTDWWPGTGTAVAESAPPDPSVPPGGVDAGRALYLQSSVDAAALALGGALSNGGLDEDRRDAMLAASLGDLTFQLGGAVYFTAWRGTRVFYSPLSPDAGNMDFAEALDARGVPFVRRMEEAARSGGGFVRVLLPEAPAGPRAHGPVVCGTIDVTEPGPSEAGASEAGASEAGGTAGQASPPLEEALPGADTWFFTDAEFCPRGAGRCPVAKAHPHRRDDHAVSVPEPVEQVVYVRPVPGGEEHIAAFMPLDAPEDDAARAAEAASIDELREKGLRLSGLSLAGLAGLLFAAGGIRRDD